MSENKKAKKSAYEQQENRLSAQSVAFIKLLTQRGILGDAEIDDDKIRQAQKEKKRHTYHNTEMLLQHYRDIVWALECFPSTIVGELDRSIGCLDDSSAMWCERAWITGNGEPVLKALRNRDCFWIG